MEANTLEYAIGEYIMAMKFTDTREETSREYANTRVTNALKNHARMAIMHYFQLIEDAQLDISAIPIDRLADCLWYDRQGHGVSIQDDAHAYGIELTDKLYALAESMGTINTYYVGGCLSVDRSGF